MGRLVWLWPAPYIRRWSHITDEYNPRIYIGDVAAPMNIRRVGQMAMTRLYSRVWKPRNLFFSFSIMPTKSIFSHGRRLLAARTTAAASLSLARPPAPPRLAVMAASPGARPSPPGRRSPAIIAWPPEGHCPATTARLPPRGHQRPEGRRPRPGHRCQSTSTPPWTPARFQSSQIL
jgi:hypothetical protein